MATTMMPPTTHTLPPAQRLRLLRSTRKLGAVLGETPLLLESQSHSPTPPISHPFVLGRSASTRSASSTNRRVYMASEPLPRSSSLSLKLGEPSQPHTHTRSHAHMHADRPTLVLRLPVADEDPTGITSPLSPTFGLALNPPSTPTADATRRRRMAKLTRTLGENVPPELVFASASASRTQQHRRRASTLSSGVPESRRRGMDLASATTMVEEQPFSYPSTVPVPAAYPSRTSSDTFASADTHRSDAPLLPPPRLHRAERAEGWSGEWGGAVADMEDVVRNLRTLRMK
ncbi:hypothetical protein DFH06DRAFT_1317249 [Mycena polygramma]|nr:hypothetical protein DFH06DRAFT_1317249 [Mycena polygramma]